MSNEKSPESIAQRFNEIKQEIAAKAFSDSEFRERLLADPNTTIVMEYGLPDGALSEMNFNIVEEQPGVLTLPIPPALDDLELSDDQLEQVTGGATLIITAAIVTAVWSATLTMYADRESGGAW